MRALLFCAMASLSCPNCAVAMRALKAQPAGAEQPLVIDNCGQWGGYWLDAGEARHVAPFFAYLQRREVEIALDSVPTDPARACLRCDHAMRVFRLVDVQLDYCLQCHGMWLDAEAARTRSVAVPETAPVDPAEDHVAFAWRVLTACWIGDRAGTTPSPRCCGRRASSS